MSTKDDAFKKLLLKKIKRLNYFFVSWARNFFLFEKNIVTRVVNDNLKKIFKRIKIVLPRAKFVDFELQLFIAIFPVLPSIWDARLNKGNLKKILIFIFYKKFGSVRFGRTELFMAELFGSAEPKNRLFVWTLVIMSEGFKLSLSIHNSINGKKVEFFHCVLRSCFIFQFVQ